MSFWKTLFGKRAEVIPADGRPSLTEQQGAFDHWVKQLRPFAQDAYIPAVSTHTPAHNDFPKYGGLPYLRHQNDWPECPHCRHHLQLFLQLNLSELPATRESGLVQLFYCTNGEPHCESDLEAFRPFSEAVVCRKIEIEGPSHQVVPRIEDLFEEKRIVSWERVHDYPHSEEYASLGIHPEPVEAMDELLYERGYQAQEGDKLGGWPNWIQGPEYVKSPKTGATMKLFFQLDSEFHLPFMFGDAGTGYLMVNPENSEEMAFCWACF